MVFVVCSYFSFHGNELHVLFIKINRKSKNEEETVSKKRPVLPIAGTLLTTPTVAQDCTIRKLKRPKQSEIEIECKIRNNNEL